MGSLMSMMGSGSSGTNPGSIANGNLFGAAPSQAATPAPQQQMTLPAQPGPTRGGAPGAMGAINTSSGAPGSSGMGSKMSAMPMLMQMFGPSAAAAA